MTVLTRPRNLTARESLTRLTTGNQRYVTGAASLATRSPARRVELVHEQHPFATIVTCADSRVTPEFIFDQGLGELFVVRVAGNICDDVVLGTVEYGALHLGVNLVVVMGHRGCGAVAAAIDHQSVEGPMTRSHIDALITAIRPALCAVETPSDETFLDAGGRANAQRVAAQIRRSVPVMADLAAVDVLIVAAYYDIESGKVSWL